jgi:transposase
MDDKDARLAEFAVELANKEVALAESDAKIAELEVQLQRLNEKLNQNSSNSHLPPSSDGPGASKKKQRKPKAKSKSKRERGAQKGHPGAHRQLLPPERVHEFVDVFPVVCLGLRGELGQQS